MADEKENADNVYQPEPTDELTMAETLVRDALSDAQDTVIRDNEASAEANEFQEDVPAEPVPETLESKAEERAGERSRQDSAADEERGPGSVIVDEASEQGPSGAEEEEATVGGVTVVEIAASEDLATAEDEYAQQEGGAPKDSRDEEEDLESVAQIEEAFEDEGAGLSLEQDTRIEGASGFIEGSETFFRTATSNVDQTLQVAAKPKSKTSKLKHQEKGFTSKAPRRSVMETRRRDLTRVYPNGPFRAKPTDDVKIAQDLLKVPNQHDYFGYLFSAQSQRPPNYYYRYILPVYKQPLPRQHMCITGERVPIEKIHREKTILDKALPMSTLKVRWRSSRLSTVYKLNDLYAYLTIFGEIDGVYSISVNSALVVFSEIESARAVIMCPCLGFPWDPLIAEWVEPRMNNFGFYNRYLRLEEPIVQLKG